MITHQLPPINLHENIRWDEAMQALAFTILSYYEPPLAFDARINDSHQRAWGEHQFYRFAEVAEERPGFTISVWDMGGGQRRVLVAIHGLNHMIPAGELLQYATIENPTPALASRWGFVLRKWNVAAISIEAVLSSTLGSVLGYPATVVTFTGHSAGAAIAEVLARRHLHYRGNRTRLIKFASPRVGCAEWNGSYPRAIIRAGFICGRDPIYRFPDSAAIFMTHVPTFSFQTRNRQLVHDETSYSVSARFPTPSLQRPSERRSTDLLESLRQLTQPMNSLNPWYDHSVWSHRLALNELAHQIGGITEYRFRYLEMPVSNRWPVEWEPGMLAWNSLAGMVDPQPAPIPPPGRDLRNQLEAQTIRPRTAQMADNGQENMQAVRLPVEVPRPVAVWGGIERELPAIQAPRRRMTILNP